MDRLRAYEIFAMVVGKGSFTKAATALKTSPANVTRYVNELEAHLGSRLLHRTSRRLSLTESGEALHDRVKGILEEVAETEALVTSASRQARGRLRIAAPVSFGILHLASLWPRFTEAHPGVELEVSLSDRVVDLVADGYDLAIRISRGGATGHVARKLAASRNVACAAPAYLRKHGRPKTPGDLEGHACIGYSQALTPDVWHFRDAAGTPHAVRIRYVMQTNNGDTARAAALAGAGVIWQPTFLIGDDLRAGRLVPVLRDFHMDDIAILAMYASRRHAGAKVTAMVEFLASAFRGTPPWDRE